MVETINKFKKITRELSQGLNRRPTEHELAAAMDVSVQKIKEIVAANRTPVSLETPLGKEEDSRLGDFIADAESAQPDSSATDELLRSDIEGVLNSLLPREREVIRLRYGLDDGRERTLEEVGQLFGITRERVRQIEFKAMRKLRQPDRCTKLEGYLAH